jgi:hypothetical protein
MPHQPQLWHLHHRCKRTHTHTCLQLGEALLWCFMCIFHSHFSRASFTKNRYSRPCPPPHTTAHTTIHNKTHMVRTISNQNTHSPPSHSKRSSWVGLPFCDSGKNRNSNRDRSRNRNRHLRGGTEETTSSPSPLADDDYSGTGYLQRFEPPPTEQDDERNVPAQMATGTLDTQWRAMERHESAKPPSPPWSLNLDTSHLDAYVTTFGAAIQSIKELPGFLVYFMLHRISAASAALLLVMVVVFVILMLFQ